MTGAAAGQSTSTSVKVSIGAWRTASSTALEGRGRDGVDETKSICESVGWAGGSEHGRGGGGGVCTAGCWEKDARGCRGTGRVCGAGGSGNGQCKEATNGDGRAVRVFSGLRV